MAGKKLYLEYSHDDDVIIYVNGIKVVETGNSAKKYQYAELPADVVASLKPGKNLIAAYCHNRVGNGLLDFGLMAERDNTHCFTRTAEQTAVDVQATQTYYSFTCGPVDLSVKFTAPLLMNNLDLMTRPVNYLSYETASNDGQAHEISLYFEAAPQWAIDQPYQKSVSKTGNTEGITYVSTGSVDQQILGKRGDDLRIDWGYFYMAAPQAENILSATGDGVSMRKAFVAGNDLNSQSTNGFDKLVLSCNLGKEKNASGYIMLAYDDIYSIQYFGQNLRPYWNRNGRRLFSHR